MMQTTNEFLNAIQTKLSLASDYALAKRLAVKGQVISNYRVGRSLPDEAMAIKLADELDLNRGYVLASIAAERASRSDNPQIANTWRDMAEKLGARLCVAALAVAGATAVAPAPAQAAPAAASESVCIMSNRRKRKNAAFSSISDGFTQIAAALTGIKAPRLA
jgi:anion-transporting  ArsA/GET3 family ATPase